MNEVEGYEYGCLSLTQTRPFSSLKNVTILAFRGDFLSPQRNCDFETCMLQSVNGAFLAHLKLFLFLGDFLSPQRTCDVETFRCAHLIAISLTNL